jgi:Holliday junction resolvase RusA-like endonuclease
LLEWPLEDSNYSPLFFGLGKLMYLIDVQGIPASQGSHSVFNGRIVQVNSAKHKAWRNAVTFAAMEQIQGEPIDTPVEVNIVFYLPRPATVTREFPSVTPDLDKLIRAVLDSLTAAKIYTDDSRVIRIASVKLYADDRQPGALISVIPLSNL